jgi:hypothetical protein
MVRPIESVTVRYADIPPLGPANDQQRITVTQDDDGSRDQVPQIPSVLQSPCSFPSSIYFHLSDYPLAAPEINPAFSTLPSNVRCGSSLN